MSSGCYNFECAEDNQSYKVMTSNGTDSIEKVCNNAGELISHDPYQFTTICEDPAIICAAKTKCPNDCHFR